MTDYELQIQIGLAVHRFGYGIAPDDTELNALLAEQARRLEQKPD